MGCTHPLGAESWTCVAGEGTQDHEYVSNFTGIVLTKSFERIAVFLSMSRQANMLFHVLECSRYLKISTNETRSRSQYLECSLLK